MGKEITFTTGKDSVALWWAVYTLRELRRIREKGFSKVIPGVPSDRGIILTFQRWYHLAGQCGNTIKIIVYRFFFFFPVSCKLHDGDEWKFVVRQSRSDTRNENCKKKTPHRESGTINCQHPVYACIVPALGPNRPIFPAREKPPRGPTVKSRFFVKAT